MIFRIPLYKHQVHKITALLALISCLYIAEAQVLSGDGRLNPTSEMIIKYYATETPRSNVDLPDANITQLELTYLEDGETVTAAILNWNTRGILWNWVDYKNKIGYGPGPRCRTRNSSSW